jgi:hypothetical protein
MGTVRTFYPRRENAVGEVIVPVTVANVIEPANEIAFDAMVDTGVRPGAPTRVEGSTGSTD